MLLVGLLVACSNPDTDSPRSDAGVDSPASDAGVACFAPDRNLELAATPEALAGEVRGCSCVGDIGACVEGLALVCLDGHWLSTSDGPCAPPTGRCTETVATTDECLAADYDCYLAGDGGICGRACDAVFSSVTDCLEDYTVCTQRSPRAATRFCGRGPRGD